MSDAYDEWVQFFGDAIGVREDPEDHVRRLMHLRRDLYGDGDLDPIQAAPLVEQVDALLSEAGGYAASAQETEAAMSLQEGVE